MDKMTDMEKQIIGNALDTFQEVLNWCYGIDDDDSRLPLDLLNRAHETISAATIRFQPEKVLKSFEVAYADWKKTGCSGDCNGDSDVCACIFVFACPKCHRKVTASGEEMEMFARFNGDCEHCEAFGQPFQSTASDVHFTSADSNTTVSK